MWGPLMIGFPGVFLSQTVLSGLTGICELQFRFPQVALVPVVAAVSGFRWGDLGFSEFPGGSLSFWW